MTNLSKKHQPREFTKRIYLHYSDRHEEWGLQWADIEISDDRSTGDGVNWVIKDYGTMVGDKIEVSFKKLNLTQPNRHLIFNAIQKRVDYLVDLDIDDWMESDFSDFYEPTEI